MSSWILAESLSSEVSCPICLNFYQDPVRLECEHNFCRSCIAEFWGDQESGSHCPQCQEIFPRLQFKSNRLLANIVERVRQLRVDTPPPAPPPPGEPGLVLCARHEEKLKLYCQDDQEAICVVCGVSREHKDHRIVPIHETMQFCQEKLKESSVQLENRIEVLNGIEANQEKKVLELKESTGTIKSHIISEFDELRTFLQEQQGAVLEKLREEEHRILREMEDNQKKLQDEKSTLETVITNIRWRLNEEDPMSLLQDVKDLTERLKQGFPDCEVVPPSRLNVGSFRGPLQYAVWKKMRDIISPVPAPLTLDPSSANPYLDLSEDLTAVRYSYTSQELPGNLERFDFCACVLGSVGFTSGRHYWEVDVGSQPDWDVGVAAESIDREGWVILTPENGFWTFGHVEHSKIGVYLDHEGGQVSFYKADDMTHLYTFAHAFTEKLFPFFYPSADSNAKPLKLCHQLI
ncbi:zinc-binding protein A33-like [Heptranchias perlo]|uniref:zinc-binding protein A33-like n=1 Tax=Heptranchias perlo TaxID=212740 RepID=UPI003559CB87